MAQSSNLPLDRTLSSQYDLKNLLDRLYAETKTAQNRGIHPSFKGLLEYMKSEITILTAIHNIKSNKGSGTPGSDEETMWELILEKDYPQVISRVQQSLSGISPSLFAGSISRNTGKRKPGRLEYPRSLLRHLNIQTVEQALTILEKFYPQNRVLPKTAYLLEELLSR